MVCGMMAHILLVPCSGAVSAHCMCPFGWGAGIKGDTVVANRHPSYVLIVNNSHLKVPPLPPYAKNAGTMGDRIEIGSVGTAQCIFHSLIENG